MLLISNNSTYNKGNKIVIHLACKHITFVITSGNILTSVNNQNEIDKYLLISEIEQIEKNNPLDWWNKQKKE